MELQLSERCVRALGAFGLTTDDVRGECAERSALAAKNALELDERLGGGRVALLTGPSGAGKSSLLRALAARLRAGGRTLIDAADLLARGAPEERVIDLLAPEARAVPGALGALSAAGLADAFVPARRVRELSEGQRARLALALAMARASARDGAPATIVIDELAGTLDDATGASVCRALRRWASANADVRVVGASARGEVEGWLDPDLIARVGADGRAAFDAPIERERACERRREFRIGCGTMEDYKSLAHLHYRAGPPATVCQVLVARRGACAAPIGVLVVSMPTLNGGWRDLAWPGAYAQRLGRKRAAYRLNRDVRCISRLIVEPRWRGRGVASALVRAYLRSPLTRRTEVVAAMGEVCPVFARCGMKRWQVPTPVRDRRLERAVEAAGLRLWMLADVDAVVETAAVRPWLEDALRLWARAWGSTRTFADDDVRALVRLAARTVVKRPAAWTVG